MGTVKDYLDRLLIVRNEVPKQSVTIIKQNESKVLDLNRRDQLYISGTDSDNRILQPYSRVTREFKLLKGQPFDRTTLLDTGDFYRGFKIKYNGTESISIYSSDSKTGLLQDKYGSAIFGLNNDNQNKLNYELIMPELFAFIKKQLQ